MDIGKKIFDLRTSQKMSAKDVAAKVGVSAAFISSLEHHATSVSIPTLERLCVALGVSLSEFFQEDETPLDLQLIHRFSAMTVKQKAAVLNLIDVFTEESKTEEQEGSG